MTYFRVLSQNLLRETKSGYQWGSDGLQIYIRSQNLCRMEHKCLCLSAIFDRKDLKILLLHSEVHRAALAVTSLTTSASVPLGKQQDLQLDSI